MSPELLLVEVTGAPWYDEYTHEEFDDLLVEEGMQVERENFIQHDAYDPVCWKDVPEGKQPIPMRWILHQKPKPGKPKYVKARMVVQEVAKDRDASKFAATPSSMGPRLAVWFTLQLKSGILMLMDVVSAFLHARVENEDVYAIPPPSERPGAGKPGEVWRVKAAI